MEVQLIPFIGWSAVTAALFVVVALVYRLYMKKNRTNTSS